MKKILIILSLLLIISGGSLRAQELTGAVTVEGEYDPLVIETERLGEYPQVYRFELPQLSLDYDVSGKTTDFSPSILAMGVTGWNTLRTSKAPRGYIDARVGSFLNSRLDAGVWLLRDSVNTLSADLDYRSTSLYKLHGVPETFTAPERRRLYDGTLGFNYSRVVGNDGLFSTRLAYRLAYFNYYGSVAPLPEESPSVDPKVPSQTVNQVNFRAGYSSSPSLLSGWHARGELGFTGYRRFYYPDYALGERADGDRETYVGLKGGYAFPLGEGSALAVDADADLLFYADRQLTLGGFDGDWRDDYGIVSLTPAYRLQKGAVSLQAGIDIDIAFGAMGEQHGTNYSTLHLAPDIKFDYRLKKFGFFVSATGGSTPVTLAGMERFDLYQTPIMMSTRPVFSPIDGRMGLSFGPYAGFSADLDIRYAVAKGVPLGGWYQYLLGTYTEGMSPMKFYGEPVVSYVAPYGDRMNLHGFGLGLDLRYKLEGVVEASLRTDFTPQHGHFGIFNGYDRPRFILDANVGVYPVKKLKVELGYDLRALRNIYGMQSVGAHEQQLASMRLPNVSLLKAKVGYRFFDTFDVYLLAENILNRRIDILPGLQSNGFALSGGIYWEF